MPQCADMNENCQGCLSLQHCAFFAFDPAQTRCAKKLDDNSSADLLNNPDLALIILHGDQCSLFEIKKQAPTTCQITGNVIEDDETIRVELVNHQNKSMNLLLTLYISRSLHKLADKQENSIIDFETT